MFGLLSSQLLTLDSGPHCSPAQASIRHGLSPGMLQRIAQCGGLLSTSQMALFQMVGDAKSPTFKSISAMAKEMRADPLPIVSNL